MPATRNLGYTMSNHYHLVLPVDLDQAKQWTGREMIQRWGMLFTKSIAALMVTGQSLTLAQKGQWGQD